MKKYVGIIIFILLIMSLIGCSNRKEGVLSKEPISIINRGSYFEVVLDFTTGKTHYDMGVEYGEAILEAIPEYESNVDSYIAEMTRNNQDYNYLLERVNDIKSQINQDYVDEIEGIATNFSGLNQNIRGDGKLSTAELFLINLFPDVARSAQCSALSVFRQRSETKETMTARILDWDSGTKNQLARIQAVVTFKNSEKSICTIGYLGYMGCISGFNKEGVFGSILDAGTGMTYSSARKHSYPMDLRYALENYQTMNEIADYIKSPDRKYAYSHLIFLSDSSDSKVLENNISGSTNSLRDIRTEKSKLNANISWDISDSIGSVNSFLLEGNFDNHSNFLFNTARYESMKHELKSKGEEVTLDELKSIASYYKGEAPQEQTNGDLYNIGTQQIIIFEPSKLNLEVFFRPANTVLPAVPLYEKITVSFE